MTDTQIMEKPDIQDDASLTESQIIRLRDVPESVRASTDIDSSDKVSVIGETLHFKGELTAGEDLVIEGTVEGTINQGKCCLTVKPKGRLVANVNATKIFIEGKVKGDLHATVSVKVRKGGEVEGNIVAPTVALEEGATFNGNIEMRSPSDSAG
jgi:cytoskeletal protein CcmA (bactofilin family)